MQIEFSTELYNKLTEKAIASGYEDVTQFMHALAYGGDNDPRGSLSKEELAASLKRLKASDEAINSGLGIELDDAIQEVNTRHGFSSNS